MAKAEVKPGLFFVLREYTTVERLPGGRGETKSYGIMPMTYETEEAAEQHAMQLAANGGGTYLVTKAVSMARPSAIREKL